MNKFFQFANLRNNHSRIEYFNWRNIVDGTNSHFIFTFNIRYTRIKLEIRSFKPPRIKIRHFLCEFLVNWNHRTWISWKFSISETLVCQKMNYLIKNSNISECSLSKLYSNSRSISFVKREIYVCEQAQPKNYHLSLRTHRKRKIGRNTEWKATTGITGSAFCIFSNSSRDSVNNWISSMLLWNYNWLCCKLWWVSENWIYL